jgi:hypothetical protein
MANTKRRTAAAKWGVALTLAATVAFAQGASPARDPSGKPPNAAAAQSGSRFDARRLRTGRFEYLTLDHGKVVGKGCLTIRRLGDGTVAFTDDETGAFGQHWEARATASLAPLTAALCFTQGAHAVSMNLIYRGDQVTGNGSQGPRGGSQGAGDPGHAASGHHRPADRLGGRPRESRAAGSGAQLQRLRPLDRRQSGLRPGDEARARERSGRSLGRLPRQLSSEETEGLGALSTDGEQG